MSERGSSFVTRRPVAVIMVFLAALVFGFFSYGRLPVTLMPELSYPTLTVRTEYPGAAPEEVENDISRPIEETLGVVGGLRKISSISRAGISDVVLELSWDADVSDATQDVLERLDQVFLPDSAERPLILHYDPSLDPVMELSLSGKGPRFEGEEGLRRLRRLAELQLKRQLEPVSGVAAVRVRGGLEEEIHVLLDEKKLSRFGLSIQNVIGRLAQENINVAGGTIQEGRTEYMVRTLNEFQDLGQIEQTVIARSEGRDVRVGDVGTVRWSHKEREMVTRTDGGESVQIDVFKEADANIVALAQRVRAALGETDPAKLERMAEGAARTGEGARGRGGRGRRGGHGGGGFGGGRGWGGSAEERPGLAAQLYRNEGALIQVVADRSVFIKSSIDEVRNTAILGGLLAVFVLFLFLRNVKTTVIIAVSIPLSLLITFAPLNLLGISLNIMSLGGLALGIGMLVDSSIVVLESIFRCREEGDDVEPAAVRGTSEVRGAVTASTLTSIAVFFPMVFVEGIAGEAFGDLGLAVVISLLASLAVAVFFIPMLASRRGLDLDAIEGATARFQGLPRLNRMFGRWREWLGRRGSGLAGLPGWLLRSLSLLVVPVALAALAAVDVTDASFRSLIDGFRRWLRWLGGWREPGLLRGLGLGVVRILSLPLMPVYLLGRGVLSWGLGLLGTFFLLLFMGLLLILRVVLLPVLAVVFGLLAAGPLKVTSAGLGRVQSFYPRAIRWALGHTPAVVLSVMAVLALTWMAAASLESELLPEVHQGEFTFEVALPVGTPLEETDRILAPVGEAILAEREHIRTLIVTLGFDAANSRRSDEGEHSARFKVLVERPEQTFRDRLAALLSGRLWGATALERREEEVIDRLREKLARIPDLEARVVRPVLFSSRTPIEVEVHGEELDRLKDMGEEVAGVMASLPELADVEVMLKSGAPEVQIVYDRDRLLRYGLNLRDTAELVRNRVKGFEATRFNLKDRRVPILVRMAEADRESVRDIEAMVVNPAENTPIPLSAIADVTLGEGPSEVRRVDSRRVALINANLGEGSLGSAVVAIRRALDERIEWPADMTYLIAGQNEEWERSRSSLYLALSLSIFLVYVIMAAQFESLLQPLVIMFTIPLAFFGSFLALAWLGVSLSIVVFLGMILLAGIVVNNAIVMVDYINTLRRRGLARDEAIVAAGSARLRPILMTTATTVLGLAPMAMGFGDGAEIRTPMALTVIAGLITSTVLTLLIIPSIYALVDRFQARLLGREVVRETKGRSEGETEESGLMPEGVAT